MAVATGCAVEDGCEATADTTADDHPTRAFFSQKRHSQYARSALNLFVILILKRNRRCLTDTAPCSQAIRVDLFSLKSHL